MPGRAKGCLIVGLGLTGLSVARHLQRLGVSFAVADTRLQPPGLDELRQQWPDTPLWLGPLDAEILCRYEQLVVSPGISIAEPAIAAATAAGVEVVGDIELFCRATRTPILAITGSNAKSTVTSLVGLMGQVAGLRTGVGGNIGLPALDLLAEGEKDLYVLELSSFQLETTHSLVAQGATILNISEDHLDRYPGMAEYIQAKQRIYSQAAVAVFNRDDAETLPPTKLAAKVLLGFGLGKPETENQLGLGQYAGEVWLMRGEQPLMPAAEVPLAGAHGLANALAAFALGFAAGLPVAAMRQAVQQFQALPHRCQLVAERLGASWYNDSKATNVGATLAAVTGLKSENSRLWLILGGDGKGQDFSPLQVALAEGVAGVALIGRDADLIAPHLPPDLPVEPCGTLEVALQWLQRQVIQGDKVLLSPACASFDQFRGYAHRGDVFAQRVLDLPI